MSVAAVIDVGTNSTRLFVAEKEAQNIRELTRLTTITRLGDGLTTKGFISEDALKRTLDVILDYIKIAKDFNSKKIDIFATQAVREAKNSSDVVRLIEERTGIKVRVLTGQEEALLSFKGASADFLERPLAVVDIGGGSTEIVVGTDEPLYSISVPIGCVKIEEEFNLKERVSKDDSDSIILEVKKRLSEKISLGKLGDFKSAVFVGGTATTLAAIKLGLVKYNRHLVHGAEIKKAELLNIAYELATKDSNERLERFPVIEKDRAYVISAGALITVAVLEILAKDRLKVSEKDILDGYLFYYSD